MATLFLASGFSSLIYQVVWTRLLVLVFGSTTLATSTVLAVFMGGLALGSFAAGKLADRVKRPLLWYGVLEGAIGIWALVAPLLFEGALPLYRFVWQEAHPTFLLASLVRFGVASAILLVPTACMGATLPLLSRFVATSLQLVGARVGTLYAVNTAGAVGGALWSGLILLPEIGMRATTMVAAGINFVLLLLVLAMAPGAEKLQQEEAQRAKEGETPAEAPGVIRLIFVVFAVSGAVSMVYEVAWTRALLMIIGSSTYAFTVMLSTFLIGIFAGSLLCARLIDRTRQPLPWFAITEMLVFLCAFLALFQFNLLPWWNLQINAALPDNPDAAMLARFLLAGTILLPLSSCIGATFPIAVKACTRQIAGVGGTVGTLYAANTLGAIVGAFAAGFALIPLIGVEKTICAAAVTNFLLGTALFVPVSTVGTRVKIVSILSCLALIGWIVLRPGIWDRTILSFAQPERRKLISEPLEFKSFDDFVKTMHQRGRVVFWRDGSSSNVAVWESASKVHHSLVTNGHIDGSDGGDMPVQVLLAGFPLMLKPEAKDVGVVGWGTGVTAGTTTRFPVESITVIELEPSVVQASPFFHHVNHAPENDRRVTVEYNDARNYLLATERKFDVLISEPSNPWQAGVCNLFTSEYFKICRACLKPGGIFSLWLQTNEVAPDNMRSVLGALGSAFPYQLAMAATPSNLVVLASDAPLTIDQDKLDKMLANKAIASELSRVGVKSSNALIGRFQADSQGIARLAAGHPPNIDDTNHLEYAVGKTYESSFFGNDNRKLLDSVAAPPPLRAASGTALPPELLSARLAAVAEELLSSGNPVDAMKWARMSLDLVKNADALRVNGSASLAMGRLQQAYQWWQQALDKDPRNLKTLYIRCATNLHFEDLDSARRDYERILEIDPADRFARYAMAERSLKLKEPAAVALKHLGSLPDDEQFVAHHNDVLYVAAQAECELGRTDRAKALVERYLKLQPRSVSGSRLLGTILFKEGDTLEATAWWTRSLNNGMVQAEPMYRKAAQLLQAGDEANAAKLLRQAFQFFPKVRTLDPGLAALAKRDPRLKRIMDKVMVLSPYE
ncbi:MAG TPA: fused MFS/spermidine synthase [Candidatus Obscuribacterales bacterium]